MPLESLVTTELVAPDGGGGVAPEGVEVQVDVEGGGAERREGVARSPGTGPVSPPFVPSRSRRAPRRSLPPTWPALVLKLTPDA